MRLIDADALLEKMQKTDRYFSVKFDIEEAPTINPEDLRAKGRWIDGTCSVCNFDAKSKYVKVFTVHILTKFCPNCGTPME